MSKDPTFEDLIAIAKEKALKERGEEAKTAGGPSVRHTSTILDFLKSKEEKDNDIILHLDTATHEQFIICRSEKYAVVTSETVGYHYLFDDKFENFELMLS